jgi:hypothetical protein
MKRQTGEHIDWRWPFSCVHSVILVFLSQYADGGCAWPTPFLPIYPLYSSYVAPSSPQQDKRDIASCARIYRPSFHENKPKRSFSLNRKRAFWLVFAKTGSIISGTVLSQMALLTLSLLELRRPLCCAEQLACEREELTSLEYDGPCIDETYRKQSHHNH